MKTIITHEIEKRIDDIKNEGIYSIIVLSGIIPYIDISRISPYISDIETFNREIRYNDDWASSMWHKLKDKENFHILSYDQFFYLNREFPNIFIGKTKIIYNNLFHAELSAEILSAFDESERVNCLEDNYLYNLSNEIDKEPFFKDEKELKYIGAEKYDKELSINAIEKFVKDCFNKNDFTYKVLVSSDLRPQAKKKLRIINFLFSCFNGELMFKNKQKCFIKCNETKESTLIFHKYWGEESQFRDLKIYEDPDSGDCKTIDISQKQIVDTIINEAERGINGNTPKDIFVTAPTGSGKSLLFQIPAIYAAQKGYVTIVITPLIALMQDQINSLETKGLKNVVTINSDNYNYDKRKEILERLKQDGDERIDVLYISPEFFVSFGLHNLIENRRLGLLVFDEAHTISTWGKAFRPYYWYIGTELKKIRNKKRYKFPIVALTATAVYGGDNDIAFDIIDNLNMNNPHKFIGEIRRNDIEFIITSNVYSVNKILETAEFIQDVDNLKLKTLVYVPFKNDITKIVSIEKIKKNINYTFYDGTLDRNTKENSFESFRKGEKNPMLCTKAFGMGIDIPDIQIVYHHALSETLSDYIQEIGRVARASSITGIAAINYSPNSLSCMEYFHRVSIKSYQLHRMIKKIYNQYQYEAIGDRKEILLSANDFSHIFETSEENEIENKVFSSLLMIEESYSRLYTKKIISVSPKSKYTTVFAKISSSNKNKLEAKYSQCFDVIEKRSENEIIISLDLEKYCELYRRKDSFQTVSSDFFGKKLLLNDNIELIPFKRITFSSNYSKNDIFEKFQRVFDIVLDSFKKLSNGKRKTFTENDFLEIFRKLLKHKNDKAEAFVALIFSLYKANCLLKKFSVDKNGDQYYTANLNKIKKYCNDILKNMNKLELNKGEKVVIYKKFDYANQYIELGRIMEVLDLGFFETAGGIERKFLLRVYRPQKLKEDSEKKEYKNSIVTELDKRHQLNKQIFNYFFTHEFDNNTRWNFIEDFFLGMSNDELIEKYNGRKIKQMDIVDGIKFYLDK